MHFDGAVDDQCMNFLVFTDLLVDMLCTLASYSITVRELKMLFSILQAAEGQWVSRPSITNNRVVFLRVL